VEIQDPKIAKNSPSAHHRTTLLGYIFASKALIDSRKNLLNSFISAIFTQNMVNFSPLTAKIGSLVWAPSKFQHISRIGVITAPTSLTRGHPNFARCLIIVSWVGTLYIYFRGLSPWWNFVKCKIHFAFKSCVLLCWQRYCTALQQRASAKLCGVGQEMELRNFRRGHHLYLAGRPLRWASAHILVLLFILAVKCYVVTFDNRSSMV